MLIVGKKEEKIGSVSVRQRGEKDLGTMTTQEFLKKIHSKIDSKAIF